MAVWNVAPFKFNITGNDTLRSPWREITTLTPRENNHWTIAALPNYAVNQAAYVDMGLNNPAANAINEDRLTLAENGRFVLNIKGVEHIDAAPNKTVNLEVVGRTGFTTDGSFNSVRTNVGNHELFYTGATRDSSLFTGTGWDQLRLSDHPGVGGTQYWSLVRRADGEVDAYSLYSGYRVRMEGGGATWGNTNGVINYGEVDEVFAASRLGGTDVFRPGVDIPDEGDRGSFYNIDLSDTTLTQYTDRLIAASFKSIHYATQNVHVGTAIVETFNGDTTGGVQSASYDQIATNGNHHLLVNEEQTAIDGHLRLYVRNNNSGLYNRFNEVYLGTSASELNANNYSTTSRNAYATDQNTGAGATSVLGTAMFGFGGNDILTGGTDTDYLFGGTSTFTTIPVSSAGLPGNMLTGGTGSDYFGVGNISAGNDGDAIMTTNFTARLAGTAPLGTERSGTLARLDLSDAADLGLRVATDRITDWTAGVDHLRVLANGTAIIEGLGSANGGGGAYVVDTIGGDAELIDLSGSRVNNEGKIVARGLGGQDTLVGSTGDDWLYGNAASNVYDLGEGGNDRVYIDQFDGSRSKHYVENFTTSSGSAANSDLVVLNKRIIDTFFAGGASRAGMTSDVNADYVRARAYSEGLNFLHDPNYNPSIAAPNSTHTNADGGAFWDRGAQGSDGTTSWIGLGMAIAGRGLLAVPIVGPIIGGVLIAGGTLLGGVGFYPRTTVAHQNATYGGDVSAYLNVLTDISTNSGNGVMLAPNTTIGLNDSGVRFLDFFQGNNAGDGYIPVVEFTAHAGQGIYGYFALHSDEETFVYLVASRDNLVENGEAILTAQINGRLTAADFGIYDGELDIYNYGVLPPVVLRDPAITSIVDDATPTPDRGDVDGIIVNAVNPILISGSVSGALSAGSYLRVYDGATKIYDGDVAVAGQAVTLNLSGTNFTFTDSRPLGTTVRNTTNNAPVGSNTTGDDTFFLTDARVIYTVELVDGETGIPTRISSRDITIGGGNATINGGDGSDILVIAETSPFINSAADGRLVGIETIVLSGPVTESGNPVVQTQTPINLDLSSQSEGFQIASGSAGDTIVGSQGNDTVFGTGGADSIDGGNGNDVVVYATEFEVVTDNTVTPPTDTPTNDDLRSAADLLAEDLTVIGGDGFDTLQFDTDRVDAGVVQANPNLTLADSDFAHVREFEALALNGTGAQVVTLSTNANAAFATGITVTTNATATSLTLNGAQATIAIGVTGTNNADTITGGNAADSISAGDGNDTVNGFVGADTLDGGLGTDTLVLTATSTDLNAATDAQLDSVEVLTAATAAAGVLLNLVNQAEGFTVVGSNHNDTITGGNGADSISAGNGNDTINGFVGADTLDGGLGTDTLVLTATSTDLNSATNAQLVAVEVVTAATAAAAVLLNLANQAEGITVVGSNNSDTITGGSGADSITGGNGSDTITGGAGADQLLGGGGNGDDVFIIAAAADHAAGEVITGGAHVGGDQIRFTSTAGGNLVLLNTVTQVEEVRISDASGATSGTTHESVDASASADVIRLIGNDGNNRIVGNDANNTLTGNGGADTLVGGNGADVINAGDGANSVTDAGEGADTIIHDTLGATVVIDVTGADTVTLTASETGATSNSSGLVNTTVDASSSTAAVTLNGNDGADSLTGGDGADSLTGGTGNDTIFGGNGGDTITGGNGDDTIDGGDGNDNIYGDAGADTITGGAGNDTITGGGDRDVISYAFGGGEGQDIITDFVAGAAGDRIHLTGTSDVVLVDFPGNENKFLMFNGGQLQEGLTVILGATASSLSVSDVNAALGATPSPTMTIRPADRAYVALNVLDVDSAVAGNQSGTVIARIGGMAADTNPFLVLVGVSAIDLTVDNFVGFTL